MLQKPTRENKEQAVHVRYSDTRVTDGEPSASVQEHVNIKSFSNRAEWRFGEHHINQDTSMKWNVVLPSICSVFSGHSFALHQVCCVVGNQSSTVHF